ncbi:MAG: hypothetical protein IJE65_00555 [Clostridia bacterium]|nr:hypothetical protein [Clostridia bacterium]
MKFVKNIISIICCFAVISAMFISSIISASAANDVNVELIGSALKAEPGDRFSISYCFKNAGDFKYGLTAFTGILKFDSSKVRCTKATHSSFNSSIFTTNKNLTGEVRTLYTYANLDKKPGVNSSATFVTYEFLVKKDAVGDVKFSLNFDTVVTTDYDKNPPENISLTYNTPTYTVKIVNPDAETTSSQATSSNTSSNSTGNNTASSVTSNTTSNNTTSNETSSKKPSDKAPDGNTTVKDEYLNPDFTNSNVADGDEQDFENATDTEAIQSQLAESLENALSSELASYNNNNKAPNNTLIILIAVGAVLAIGIIVTLLILSKKNK